MRGSSCGVMLDNRYMISGNILQNNVSLLRNFPLSDVLDVLSHFERCGQRIDLYVPFIADSCEEGI